METRREFFGLWTAATAALWGSFDGWLTNAMDLSNRSGTQVVAEEWLSVCPATCPFPVSDEITAVYFTGGHRENENADTRYPSLAADDNLYSPFTDGMVGNVKSYSAGCWEVPQGTLTDISQGKTPPHPTTGESRISGADPLSLEVTAVGTDANQRS